jgi:hypothetical protein
MVNKAKWSVYILILSQFLLVVSKMQYSTSKMMVNINISKILTRMSTLSCKAMADSSKCWEKARLVEVILIINKNKIDALKGAKLQDQIDVYRLPFLNW